MPRVLIAFEPPDGGVAEHVLELALGLPDRGWQAEVAGPAETTISARLQTARIPAHRVALHRGFGRPWRDVRALGQVGALARSGRFDLVHCHAAKAGALGRPAARLIGDLPVVYTPHCFGFVGEIGTARRVTVLAAERMLGRLTDALVCVSDDELRIAEGEGIGDARRRWRIYNGAKSCDEAAQVRDSLGRISRDGAVVGTIAVFRQQKRIDVLLDAAPRVLAEVPDCSIVVIGEGPLEEPLHARATELGLTADERFEFVPFAPPSTAYLRGLDLFVLPSSWEAFPISILEALACGVPQVATNVGGTPEAVSEETGILVPPRSPERLADAIIALLRDRARRDAMGRASKARFDALFRVERMVAETAEVYGTVLSRGGDRG
jgi:glycosyltransferase involved in cell wall biosynthesis